MSTAVTCNCVNLGYMNGQAQRISRRIEQLKLTHERVANKVGVSRVSVTKWCNNDNVKIAGGNLSALAECLECSVDYILEGYDPPSEEISYEWQEVRQRLGQAVAGQRSYARLSQVEAAKKAGVDLTTYFQVESGHGPPDILADEDPIRCSKIVEKIARALDSTPQQLSAAMDSQTFRPLEVREPEQQDLLQRHFDDKFGTVNRVSGAVLSAGPGAYAWEFEEVDNSHAFRREWFEEKGCKPHRCKLWKASGDSMAPFINDGDVVLINLDSTAIRSGEVFALAAGDELRLKRLHKKLDGSIVVSSDNPSPHYKDEIYSGDALNGIQIIGEVVWRGG